MIVVKDVALLVAAAVLVMAGGLLVGAGIYEMLLGRRVPGFLGREYFQSKADSWTPGGWRKNGCVVTGLGLSVLIGALWLVSFTFRLPG